MQLWAGIDVVMANFSSLTPPKERKEPKERKTVIISLDIYNNDPIRVLVKHITLSHKPLLALLAITVLTHS